MSAKHTPGPWTIEKTSDGYGVRAPQWGYVAIHHSSGLPHWEEGQAANRLLIAAAPDLLEASQWAANYIDTIIDPNALRVLASLRAAIAKATGAA